MWMCIKAFLLLVCDAFAQFACDLKHTPKSASSFAALFILEGCGNNGRRYKCNWMFKVMSNLCRRAFVGL